MSNKNKRQQWLLNKARGQQCTAQLPCCNHNPETTIAAHINLPGHGAMGAKTNDLHVAWLCSDCHDAIDGRRDAMYYDKNYLRYQSYEAVLRTQLRLFAMLTDKERAGIGEVMR